MPVIKDKFSPAYLLGKMIYPGRAPWEQRRKGWILIWTAGLSVFIGLGVAIAILLYYQKH
jgi:hypothetical protein